MESAAIGEDDLALLEAMQIAPRAPWFALAAAVGVGPATAANRWQRLLDSGAAWVTATPAMAEWATFCTAYVDITCAPTSKLSVAYELARDPHALSVDLTAGGSDLFVTVATPDLHTLGRYLLERLDQIPGIVSSRTRVATRLYTEGSSWRLGALSAARSAPLERWRTDLIEPRASYVDVRDRSLLVSLGMDGRASYVTLGEAAGVSAATARRRTDGLLRSGAIRLRTELAASLAGWPVSVVLSAQAPVARLHEVARTLGHLRSVRLCATVAGNPSLVIVAWLHTVEDIHRFELSLAEELTDLEITDRRVVLRSLKRMGRLLDEDGHALSAVPMDLWREPCYGAPSHST